ncbi:hypothetical protein [Vreelandella sp. EE27]
MNTDRTFPLYEITQELSELASKLHLAGHRMAADEVEREVGLLRERAITLDGVLDDYKLDIAAAANPRRFLGIDMAAPGKSQTFTQKVKR